MAARKRASIGAPPPPPEKSKIHIGAFSSSWGFFSLLGSCLGLPLFQKNLWESMVVSKPDAVTVTKAPQIHGASNVIFVYALQKPETAT